MQRDMNVNNINPAKIGLLIYLSGNDIAVSYKKGPFSKIYPFIYLF